MLNKLKLISAGAGSGKTYRLTEEMATLLTGGTVRPSGIIATTFTKRAAAELKERVRVRLLRRGMTAEANELNNALIGTVHGLGVKLLRRFAYEAGVSPQVDIIADGDDQRLFNLSMAAVTSLERIGRIETLCEKLALSRNGEKYNWRKDVLGLVEVIRANNFSAADIERSKNNSWHSLRLFLPSPEEGLTLDQYYTRAMRLLGETYAALLENEADGTKKTQSAAVYLRGLLNDLRQRNYLPWVDFAKLGRFERDVGAKSRELVTDLAELGQKHAGLAAFQGDLRNYQDLLFDCARDAIAEYDHYKKSRGRIDYIDMEVLVLKLLDKPGVRETLSREIDLLMVDEFQDTSPIQLAIFLRLSTLAKQSIWVGDPKQSIYGFRGAEPRLMAAVMEANGPLDLKNVQTRSWRSREDIVYACNSLFVKAFPEFVPEAVALEPVRTREGNEFAPPESRLLSEHSGLIHWHFEVEGKGRHSIKFMQATLAKAINDLLAAPPPILPKDGHVERPLRAGDIAILCRSNYGCIAVAEALAQQGIPTAIARGGLTMTAEATLVLACLKYVLNPGDSLSVAEIMLFGSRHSLSEIIDHRLDYLHRNHENKPGWGSDEALLQALDALREATAEYATSELLDIILERTDLRRIAVAWGNGEQRLSNIDELRRLAIQYEDNCHRQHRAASLGGYLLYLDQLVREEKDMQGASEREDAVNVLTYHRSKGLEWPAVICFNLDQSLRADVWGRAVVPDDPAAPVDLSDPLANRWLRYWVNPYDRLSSGIDWVDALNESDWKAQMTEQAVAEEARLLYVGFTRARDYLIMPTGKTGAPWVDRAYGRGGSPTIVLSPETTETPFSWEGRDIDKSVKTYREPTSQPRRETTYQPLPFISGARPGRDMYTPLAVDEAFILEHYGDSRPGREYRYHPTPVLDPAIDLRAYARTVSRFLMGDPGSAAPSEYRIEVAANLLGELPTDHRIAAEELLSISDAYQSFIDQHWPGARVDQLRDLQGLIGDRFYSSRIPTIITSDGGEQILIAESCLPAKQYQSQSGARLGEVRLQADLLEQINKTSVIKAFLHFPAHCTLMEVNR